MSLTGLIVISGQSFAGTNGQQLEVCTQDLNISNVIFIGTNEKGQKDIQTRRWGLTKKVTLQYPWRCASIKNWWWVGKVQVNFYTASLEYRYAKYAYVPGFQSSSDWVTAYL
jgi:hypothetical protein